MNHFSLVCLFCRNPNSIKTVVVSKYHVHIYGDDLKVIKTKSVAEAYKR